MKKVKKTWTKNLASLWGNWTPPDRPSPGEMKVYENYLKQ